LDKKINGMEITHANPLILDPNTLGDDPQHHEGKYSCIYETSQSNNEVTVYAELQGSGSEAMFNYHFLIQFCPNQSILVNRTTSKKQLCNCPVPTSPKQL